MATSFRAYIDESGDEGFRFLEGELGSSRWLVLSAVVFRKSNDLAAVELLKQARVLLGKAPKKPLHFRELKHEQRLPFARLIGNARIRTISVMVHKPSIVEPETFQAEAHRLYRYCSRLLLERISWLCRDNRKTGDGDGGAELVFSNRSAMSYDALRVYLERLKANSEAQDVRIDWSVIDPIRVEAINHDQLAGLQIADAVASSMFYALNKTPYGEVEPRYMELLASTIYRNRGRATGNGLKFWPDWGVLRKKLEHLSVFEPHL